MSTPPLPDSTDPDRLIEHFEARLAVHRTDLAEKYRIGQATMARLIVSDHLQDAVALRPVQALVAAVNRAGMRGQLRVGGSLNLSFDPTEPALTLFSLLATNPDKLSEQYIAITVVYHYATGTLLRYQIGDALGPTPTTPVLTPARYSLAPDDLPAWVEHLALRLAGHLEYARYTAEFGPKRRDDTINPAFARAYTRRFEFST
jgi:hypothetical protein